MTLLNELKSCRERLSAAIKRKNKIDISLWQKNERRIMKKIKKLFGS